MGVTCSIRWRGYPFATLRTTSLVVLMVPVLAASAQNADASRTTLSGVFTTRQATRGQQIYAGSCRSCHTPASHTGATFEKWWAGRTLGDLFSFMSEQMPKNDPGGLAPQEYADVLAYLLTMNKMPAGKQELSPDSAAVSPVRIVMRPLPKAVSRSTTSIRVRKDPCMKDCSKVAPQP